MLILDRRTSRRPAIATGLVALAMLALAAGPAQAGPWTKDLGQFYVKLNEGVFVSDSFIDANGKTVAGTDYLGLTTSVYFELGVWRGVQLVGLVPYTVGRNSLSDGIRTLRAGGGDLLLGLQASPPWKLPLRLAARLEAKIPLYDVSRAPEIFATRYPAFGDGQLDLTLWFAAGGSFARSFYTWAEIGYRFRTEGFVGDAPSDGRSFSDSVAWLGQVGWSFYKRMVLAVNAIGVMALAGKDDLYTKSYLTLGPSVYLPVYRGLAIEASFDPILYARNSAPGISFSFGVSYAH